MRQNKINILRYLPAFIYNDANFKAVGDTLSAEQELTRLQLQDIFEQCFVETATWGLDYYERVLALTPDAGDDYDTRRRRILVKYQDSQTSTVAFLTALAKKYFDTGTSVNIEEQNSDYAFSIISSAVSIDVDGLTDAIKTYKPAHLAAAIVHALNSTGLINYGSYALLHKQITISAANSKFDVGSNILTDAVINSYTVSRIEV